MPKDVVHYQMSVFLTRMSLTIIMQTFTFQPDDQKLIKVKISFHADRGSNCRLDRSYILSSCMAFAKLCMDIGSQYESDKKLLLLNTRCNASAIVFLIRRLSIWLWEIFSMVHNWRHLLCGSTTRSAILFWVLI